MGVPMDRSKLVFMQLGSFEEAFPELETAEVKYTEFSRGTEKRTGTHDLKYDGGLLKCANDRCYRGGYQLDREVRRMIREGLTEKKLQMNCPGDEGTPKLRRGPFCSRTIRGTIKIELKESHPQQR